MREPIEDNKPDAGPPPAESPKRLAWEEPTLHRLSLSKTELGGAGGTDGLETFS